MKGLKKTALADHFSILSRRGNYKIIINSHPVNLTSTTVGKVKIKSCSLTRLAIYQY